MSLFYFFDAQANQTARAQEILQPCPVLVGRRADFLYDNRLHDFALHGILAPRFNWDAAPHNLAPLVMNLERQLIVPANAEPTDDAASHQESQQHPDAAWHSQNRHRPEKSGIEIGKRVWNGIHSS